MHPARVYNALHVISSASYACDAINVRSLRVLRTVLNKKDVALSNPPNDCVVAGIISPSSFFFLKFNGGTYNPRQSVG